MKIVFLCGCLEPGCDGVGDYTRRLAGEVVRQGHEAAIVSLNDHFVKDEIMGIQYSEEIELPVLRIPSAMTNKKRFERTKKFIDAFDPYWLSVQYVPYSFHLKGLPFSLNNLLGYLRQDKSVHIMFHELWVGDDDSLKLKVYSLLQKLIIKQIKKKLNPDLVHTHLRDYYVKLKNLKFEVKPLPLFSNIDVKKNGVTDNAGNVSTVGAFSHITIHESISQFLQHLKETILMQGMSFEILLIGDNDKLKKFGTTLENLNGFKNLIKYTGFSENEKVSHAIQTCSMGLTSVPTHALGKSGSVAAFLFHGIPVAAFSNDSNGKEGFFSSNLCNSIIATPDLLSFNRAKTAAFASQEEIEIAGISERFLSDLHNSTI